MEAEQQWKTTNLVVVSDLHCGCQLGLCPPEGARLDEGGTYLPTKAQVKLWGHWQEFWNDWVPQVCRDGPFDVVINGDVVDGVHHRSTTQISQNPEDQAAIALAILRPIKDRCERLYMIRGTEAHVGSSGTDEEKLAKQLDTIPDEDGRHARYELRKRVGKAVCSIMHHIGGCSRHAYETSGPQAEIMAEWIESVKNDTEAPDFVIRSHRHRAVKVDHERADGVGGVIVTPGWQLKTPFTFKMGARTMEPEFGGIVIRQGDEEFYARLWKRGIEPPRIEE